MKFVWHDDSVAAAELRGCSAPTTPARSRRTRSGSMVLRALIVVGAVSIGALFLAKKGKKDGKAGRGGRASRTSGKRCDPLGAFVDLTPVFRDETGTVYVDTCCHFNALGYEHVTDAIARALREAAVSRGGASSPPGAPPSDSPPGSTPG